MHNHLLAVVLLTTSACTGKRSAEDQLVGTWKLVSASSEVAGEPPENPYGVRPSGVLIYTAEGQMVVVHSNERRQPLSVDDRAAAPVEERASAFATHSSYAGRYELRGDRVVHNVEIASVPNWVGQQLLRDFKLDGDKLTLSTPPIAYRGRRRTFTLTWQRVG